ncbi:unnamed protein product, partial [Mesorhabditis belari]|uniref:Gamma interferon inducible lysosomal thiol reductase n=1 Tax=Mesorhabditis belari TaxID=2138241 RepID=A0AAF3EZG2_9BILA
MDRLTLFFALLLMGFVGICSSQLVLNNVGRPNLSLAAKNPIGNTVKLDVYMEAQCPDTSRFVHKQLMKAWEKLGTSGRVEWTIIPFGKARCTEKGGDFECQCQHGSNECILNQLMNCVIEKTVYPEKFIPIVNCIQGERNLESATDKCLTEKEGLDQKLMKECASGSKGRRLLALAGARTVALRPPLTFVPWIVIDGERVADALYDLTDNLCKKLQPAPEGCAEYTRK